MRFFVVVLVTAVSFVSSIPPDWEPLVQHADMLYSNKTPDVLQLPNIGNGFIGLRVGPFIPHLESCELGNPQVQMGGLHLAGVFNGVSNSTPSHRAHVPAMTAFTVATTDPSHRGGSALDLRYGVVYNRTTFSSSACSGQVQTLFYAHRAFRSLMVAELSWISTPGTFGNASCSVPLTRFGVGRTATPDFNLSDVSKQFDPSGKVTVWSGYTLLAEKPGVTQPTGVGLAFDQVPSTVTLTSSSPTRRFLFVAHSSLEPGLTSQETFTAAAMEDYLQWSAMSSDSLMEAHKAAWDTVGQSGLEVSGNVTTAAALNSSLYYIRASVREDWPYSLSPGGIAIDAYDGNTFWDSETMMLPSLSVLTPSVGRSLLLYRQQRLDAAKVRAKTYGFQGANWPWQSALSGFDCVMAPNTEGQYEQHITGDIVMAHRLYHYLTNDTQWLETAAWPVLEASCQFFESRFERKNGTGNYTISHVQPPAENAGVVDDEIYTNTIGAMSLAYCVEVGELLGLPTPVIWGEMSRNVYQPLVTNLLPGKLVHPEFTGYHGQMINQADTCLLQYPLEWPMPDDVALNDLTYYIPKVPSTGMFTGDLSFGIALLALGQRAKADAQWQTGFAHQDIGRFNLWRERTDGGHLNFITGAGTFLQAMMMGYGGLRIHRHELLLNPVLPPFTSGAAIRRAHYLDLTWSLFWTDSVLSLTSLTDPSVPLCAVDSNGTSHRLSSAEPLTIPLGRVSVRPC